MFAHVCVVLMRYTILGAQTPKNPQGRYCLSVTEAERGMVKQHE
jgi:hypothetical protein